MKMIDGSPVANAVTRLRVEVTRQDIEKGQPLNPNACAIARACLREVPGCVAAKVHFGRLYTKIEGRKQWQRRAMPEYALREQIAFDRGGKMVPQVMYFDPVPVEAVIKSAPKKTRRSAPGRSGPKRQRHRMVDVRPSAYTNEPNERA